MSDEESLVESKDEMVASEDEGELGKGKRARSVDPDETEDDEVAEDQKTRTGEAKQTSSTAALTAHFDKEKQKMYVEYVAVGSWRFAILGPAWTVLMEAFVRDLEVGKNPNRHAVVARWEERMEEIKDQLLHHSIHTRHGEDSKKAMEHAFLALRWVSRTTLQKPKGKAAAAASRRCVFTGTTKRLISMTMISLDGQTRLPEFATVPRGKDMRSEVFVIHERYEMPLKALAYVLHMKWRARHIFMKLDDSNRRRDVDRQEAWTSWTDLSNKNFNEACAHLREFFTSPTLFIT